MSEFIIATLAVFAISSGWLYSELPSGFRNWWRTKFKGKKLEYLAICQLCCSVWFALPIMYIVSPESSFIGITLMSFAAAGVSWLLGAITQYYLWHKALVESQLRQLDDREIEDGSL